jgi:hypothetical protein
VDQTRNTYRYDIAKMERDTALIRLAREEFEREMRKMDAQRDAVAEGEK